MLLSGSKKAPGGCQKAFPYILNNKFIICTYRCRYTYYMRFILPLLLTLTVSCMQSAGGGGKKGTSVSPVSTTGGSSSSDGRQLASTMQMVYESPQWPSTSNAGFWWVPSFASLAFKEASRELASDTAPSDKNMPVMPIKYSDQTNGKNFCFTNLPWKSDSGTKYFPDCIRAHSSITQHAIEKQDSGSGEHSVMINALQFHFKNANDNTATNDDNYSQVYFDSAYVEKSLITFDGQSGNPIISEKTRYNYGSGSCNIEDQDAVGFAVEDQASHRFVLSGISSFERGRKKIFGEGTLENRVYEATECTGSTGGFLCNLIADKVSVWHAMFVPILRKKNGVLRKDVRQYPSQVVSNGKLVGAKSAAASHFGYYSGGFTDVPEKGASTATAFSTPIMGKYDRDGNLISGWEERFITGFCLKGRRKEKTGWTPLVQAMYFELKSPSILTK